MIRMLAACLVCLAVVVPSAAPPPPAGHPPIAHAGDAVTTEAGVVLRLDGSWSWDADGDALTFAWTQTDGPVVTLNLADPVHPTFAVPTPGQAGVPAENQVLVFSLVVNDGSSNSAPSEVRIMVLKPFDPVADGPAIVTNGLPGTVAPGSIGYAMTYAIAHPGTRVTFNIPATDPSYNPTGGYWQMNHGVPVMRYLPALGIGLLARGMTIDGFSQKTNAAAAGAFVNPTGPAIFLPGGILEIGGWSDPAPYPSRIVVRGLAEEMHIEKGDDIVLSGNYHNVYPDGLSSIRGAFDHVGFSSGGTTCVRLAILGGSHIRIGGPTPEERNIIGRGCNGMEVYPAYGLSDLQIVGNYFGVDRLGANGIIGPGGRTGLQVMANGQALDVRIGGVTPGSRNVFAGYDSTALYLGLLNPGLHAVVQGNYFGTNAAGDAAIPSGYNAFVESTALGELLIGGPEPGAGNLFSGSALGIYFSGGFYAPWNAAFQGNRVGTRADGMSALPNRIGIATAVARGILIGGSGPGEGNLVSGNTEEGISIGGSWSFDSGILLGNRVGVAADGVTPLGNGGSGIVSASGGFCCPIVAPTIGGINPGEGNLVAHNGRHGVLIDGNNKYGAVRGNSIFSNGLLGISLSNSDTPHVNDAGDGDDGANYLINYPELLTASSDGPSVTITGLLDTLPGRPVSLDFYANDTGDPSGHGEGQRYLGTHSFTTPPVYAGAVPFTAIIPGSVTAAQVVSATTTDPYGTSEFGRYIAVSIVDHTAPSFSCPAPRSATANASGVAPVPDVLAGLVASDNVTPSGSLTMEQSPAAGTLVGVGPHPITVTVSDAAGNTRSCTTSFTVNDTTAPVFACPAASSATAGSTGQAPVPDVLAGLVASDNVTPSASLTMTQSPAAGTLVGVGPHPITITVTDAAGNSSSCQSTFTVNPAPPPPGGDALSCSAARPTVAEIWPPNHKKVVTVGVTGVTGAGTSPISILMTRILQDEPTNITGDGNTPTDGGGLGTSQAWVRAERAGTPQLPGNGRVYELQFTASSTGRTSCTGVVFVGVPHDQGKGPAIDDLIRYDSTVAGGGRVR